MAHSILQQILENVQGGTLLPMDAVHGGARTPQTLEPEQLDRIAAGVLARIDAELEQFLVRVISHPEVRRIARRDDHSRRELVTRLDTLLRAELGQLGAGLVAPGSTPPPRSATEPAPAPPPEGTRAPSLPVSHGLDSTPFAAPDPLASSEALPDGIVKVLADLAERAAGEQVSTDSLPMQISGSG